MDVSKFDEFKPVVISAIIVMNITLNVLTIAVICRYPQLREDRTSFFVFSLALSDLANGCTAMPISAALCSRATPNVRDDVIYFPKIHAVFSIWFTITSMYSLCLVTVCKMVAITNPLRYEQLLTRNRCILIICGLWSTGAIVSPVAYFAESWNLNGCIHRLVINKGNAGLLFLANIIGIVIPMAGLVYSTMQIFLTILRTHRQITAQINSIGGGTCNVANIPYLTLKSVRSGRNVLIICLALIALTIPYCVNATVALLGFAKQVPLWFDFAAIWLILSNSFINSLIYILIFRCVRDKTSQMLREICTFTYRIVIYMF